MNHATDHPASQQRICSGCGSVYHPDHKSGCAAGMCPPVTPPGLTAHQALNLIGHVLACADTTRIAFVRQEDDGWSFYTNTRGVLQRWIMMGDGLSEYLL